jgi:putative DNA primase/helicase
MSECSFVVGPDVAHISQSINLFFSPETVFEVRVLGADGEPGHTLATFSRGRDAERMAPKIAAASAGGASGVYFTPHGGQSPLAVKSWCNLSPVFRNKDGTTNPPITHDADIPKRRFLIIDVDPVRAAGHGKESSTDGEKAAALDVLASARGRLMAAGWSEPIVVDSGNGYHAYYRLDMPLPGGAVNSTTDPLATVLRLLDTLCSTDAAKVDTTVYNSNRLMKIPGTVSRKGTHTAERPHRVSKVLSVPADWHEPTNVGRTVESLIESIDPTGELRASLRTPTAAPVEPAHYTPTREHTGDVMRRASAYLAKMPGAIQGQNGSAATYAAATALVHGFGLSTDEALSMLAAEYNPRCVPAWSESELAHKVNDAATKPHSRPKGWILMVDSQTASGACPSPRSPVAVGQTLAIAPHAEPVDDGGEPTNEIANPHRLAEQFLRLPESKHLRSYQGDFVQWRDGSYGVLTSEDVRATVTKWVAREFNRCHKLALRALQMSESNTVPPKKPDVTVNLVGNVLNAMRGEIHIMSATESPSWIDGGIGPNPKSVIACRNGLYDIETDTLFPQDPKFFTFSAAPFDFDRNAPKPVQWLRFLAELWPTDQQSIDCLQEWFGYLLTPDTRLQKMLFILGRRRAGKGTITRILKELVGKQNYCGPTINSLTTDFGLSPLIGKSLALIEDARLSGRVDADTLTENLLSISGEGAVTINRKHRDPVTLKLPTRFVIVSNELPKIKDASGALAGRMIVLSLSQSFFGREDIGLGDRLVTEMPGILLWAIEGWKRLNQRNKFLQPDAGEGELAELENLGSPVGAFVRERCVLGLAERVDTKELFAEWKRWCEENGRDNAGNVQVFGRDLKSIVSGLQTKEVRQNSEKFRIFVGIRLRDEIDENESRESRDVSRDCLYARMAREEETDTTNGQSTPMEAAYRQSRETSRDSRDSSEKPGEL